MSNNISKVQFKSSSSATPVVWMDTTDKTVTAGDMLNGITALKNDGTTATGNIQNQTAQTIYPSTNDQTIASGKYLSGTQTVKGVLLTNLSAANVKKDVVIKVGDSVDDDRITAITGTYEGSGGGGGSVTQDQDGFIVLPPTGGSTPSGGLEYESGTFTPTENEEAHTITFSNTHSTAPYSVIVFDNGATDMGAKALMYWNFTDYNQLGALVYSSGNTIAYSRIVIGNRTSTSASHGTTTCTDATASESYVSSSRISMSLNSNSQLIATRTYEWIAVWAPTT